MAREREELQFVTPVASSKLRPMIEEQLDGSGLEEKFRLVEGDSIEVMSASDVVMLASGTAALESALLGKPTVAGYQVGKTTVWIARRLGIREGFKTIPNIVADEELIPEFMQEEFSANGIAGAVARFLDEPQRREAVAQRFAKLREELALGADDCAAEAIIELAG